MRAKRSECHILPRRFFSVDVILEQVLSNGTYARQQVKERGEDIVEEGWYVQRHQEIVVSILERRVLSL